jgi:hypothetical protein
VIYHWRHEKKQITFTGNPNNGISIRLHPEKLDDLLDVVNLLLVGNVGGLTEDGAEAKCFTYSGRVKVKILLLNITRFALERLIPRPAVDEHFTGNNTHSNTSRKDIQQCCLTGTRDTLR